MFSNYIYITHYVCLWGTKTKTSNDTTSRYTISCHTTSKDKKSKDITLLDKMVQRHDVRGETTSKGPNVKGVLTSKDETSK